MFGVEFILYSDHKALIFLKGQKKLNSRHPEWVSYLDKFHYVLQHKPISSNKVTDALSHTLLTTLSFEFIGLELLPDHHALDVFFSKILQELNNGTNK